MDLKDYRQQIDTIDHQLVQLFLRRMQIAANIADYKKHNGLPVLDAVREQQKLDTVCDGVDREMQPYVRQLYQSLFALSRQYQTKKNARCGLIGRTLGHSYSPAIHRLLGSYPYELFEIEPEKLEDFLLHGAWTGLNVTMPYKKAVIPYCDELSPLAAQLQSVNTLVRRTDGTIFGDNTDAWGFARMLQQLNCRCAGKKALVLGSGGASVTVQAVLRSQGAQVVMISRSGADNYANLDRHDDAAILVNATPVGMYPNSGEAPVDLELLPHLEAVLDLVYNPVRTRLILDAERRQIPCLSGLTMLVAQAVRASELFTDTAISAETVAAVQDEIARQTENLVLIGMPGSGKTTVGKLLAAQTGKRFVDADEELEKRIGSIPAFFAAHGESAFRKEETALLAQLGQQSGLVLATGGGCVTRTENRDLLRQNGTVICLLRDLNKLPSDRRPMSQQHGVEALYRQRKPLYEFFADFSVDNNGSPEQTVQTILNRRIP